MGCAVTEGGCWKKKPRLTKQQINGIGVVFSPQKVKKIGCFIHMKLYLDVFFSAKLSWVKSCEKCAAWLSGMCLFGGSKGWEEREEEEGGKCVSTVTTRVINVFVLDAVK